jgi:DNA-binding Lrp family transcriptional regulator
MGYKQKGEKQMVDVILLRTYMRKARVTQKQLAKLLGMSEQTMSNRLRQRVFSTREAAKIAEVLSIRNPATVFLNQEMT